jgi:hypothetical protein
LKSLSSTPALAAAVAPPADHVNLNIEKSKTDIYREGKDVIISATNNYTCPVAMLSRYLLLA